MTKVDQLCVDTLRFLAVDAVEAAKSGHPGLPLGAAPMAYVIYDRYLRFNPKHPQWFNRDRFVLSAGHGSALLYATLHSFGYDLPLDEVKRFRQWGSLTPGHPEYGHTPGVECTTGPLGAGFSMGVGMAMAERFLAGRYNVAGADLVDHYTYAIVSDGDLMEGISSEAASLAGHLKLGKLIYLYDDNQISIEGSTELAFTEDVPARFRAYNWQVLEVADGNDVDAIGAAIEAAQADQDHPSLIVVKTHIGFGSPKQDTAGAHGEPLGAEAMAATRKNLGWPAEPFFVPEEAKAHMLAAVDRGAKLEADWTALCASAPVAPELLAELQAVAAGELPAGWESAVPVFAADKDQATRSASGTVLNALGNVLPNLLGGSADLAPSNKSDLKCSGDYACCAADCGRNIHFGVREHVMGAIVNGMAVHGGVIPYGATFLVFADYMRPQLRLSALMGCHALYIFTHDSIGVGEDGPTHQPIEQVMSLRAIPGLAVYRPADANETAQCWKLMIERQEPALIALTRQNLPTLDMDKYPVAAGVARGAYVLSDAPGGDPQLVLLATGSEVALALAAQEALAAESIRARVVSMPCWELFEAQCSCYQAEVLPAGLPKLALEAGCTLGWQKWVGTDGKVIGLDHFGASAPAKTVFAEFGFTVDNVVQQARGLLEA